MRLNLLHNPCHWPAAQRGVGVKSGYIILPTLGPYCVENGYKMHAVWQFLKDQTISTLGTQCCGVRGPDVAHLATPL